jgi:hypothetical protein
VTSPVITEAIITAGCCATPIPWLSELGLLAGKALADEVGSALSALRPAEAPAVMVVGNTTVWDEVALVLIGAGLIWSIVHEDACPDATAHDELYSIPWLLNWPDGQTMVMMGIRVVNAGLLTVRDVPKVWEDVEAVPVSV